MDLTVSGAEIGFVAQETEVSSMARRRRFTAEYKQKILKEAAACTRPGEIGALLRREGLYSSNFVEWRRAQERGVLTALAPKKRGPAAKEVNPLARKVADWHASPCRHGLPCRNLRRAAPAPPPIRGQPPRSNVARGEAKPRRERARYLPASTVRGHRESLDNSSMAGLCPVLKLLSPQQSPPVCSGSAPRAAPDAPPISV